MKPLEYLKWFFKIGWRERRDLRYSRVIKGTDLVGLVMVSTYENIKTKELRKTVSLPIS